MFCTNCGKKIEDDAVFCTECGAKYTAAPEAGTIIEPVTERKADGAKIGNVLKSKKARLICGAAVLAVAGIMLVVTIVGNQPKAVVLRGFSKTWKAVTTEETGVAQYLGMSKLSKAVRDGNTKQSISLKVSEGATSGGINAEIRKNKNNTILVDGQLLVGDMSLIDASLYHDAGKTVATVPKLYQKSFALQHSELKEKLKSTAFIAQLNSTFDINLGKMDLDSSISTEEYQQQLLKDGKVILKNMKVKKLPKRQFTIDGKNKSCKGYEVTIQEADIKNMGQNYADMVIEDSALMNLLGEGYTAPGMVEQVIKRQTKELLSTLTEDLVLSVYVDSKDRIVFMESEYPFVYQNNVTSTKASLSLTGSKNPGDSFELQMETQETSGYFEQYTFIRTLKDEKDKIKDVLEINNTYGRILGDSYSNSNDISIILDLNKKKNQWALDIGVIESGGISDYMSIEGTLEELVQGQKVFITVDSVIDNAYTYAGQPDIAIRYGIEPLDGTIEAPPAQEQINVLELTRVDMNRIGMEVQRNIYNSGIERAFESSIFY